MKLIKTSVYAIFSLGLCASAFASGGGHHWHHGHDHWHGGHHGGGHHGHR